ncbi:GMC family oxidoreductase [Chitinophaga polysaccharea]|uniref:GMC family oxidoreductase n=1 Tax=Chitinophaga polysaccharea TaxID=1293035 RepID=UPI001455227D|nr:GMC family oxidoreductase [Chitinophaga polysaccharea]NLR58296.1 GMC family oxidoreductase [Chitinophaga polysaccharea]
MENKEYDVVIVGSGIAGAIVAKTLTQAGKQVLLLEAGLEAGMAFDADGAYKNYQEYLRSYYLALAKVPNAPYPDVKDAESPNVLDMTQINGKPDTKGYFVQNGPLPFASDYARAAGGTTLHWLGTCLRMLPNDFKMHSRYGQAVDWPIDYEYLKPYYEMAEREIGVSCDVQEQQYPNMGGDFFGKDYVFPMYKIPQSYIDKHFIEGLNGLKVSLNGDVYVPWCTSTPQGRNSTPNEKYRYAGTGWNATKQKLELQPFPKRSEVYEPVGAIWDPYAGQRCEGNASCVPICPVQAKYNALKTLKSAKKEHLTLMSQTVATEIQIDSTTGNITGVAYKQYPQADSKEYVSGVAKGKIYVLAANAIENAKLLLASDACKTSDQVGRNLMDHMVLLTWGLMKEKVFPFRGPGSTTNIPTFRDGDFRKQHAAWISPIDNWGWGWPTGSPDTDLDHAVSTLNLFGNDLKNYLGDLLSRQLLLHFECEQLPEKSNRVTISKKYLDNIGNYRPMIDYNVSDYTKKAFKASKSVSDQIFAGMGVQDFTSYPSNEPDYTTYEGQGYVFRGAGHVVGTHCMGTTAKNSVVNRDQQAWDHKNLFLVGAGNMATLGTSNPTLTLAALSFAAAENVLKALK